MSQEVSLMAAFGAGFLSFFAPCVLPLIPPYFAWLLGISQREIKEKSRRAEVVFQGIFLVLGFSIVFIVLGASASRLGQVLAPHRLLVQKVGGWLLVFFGLEFAGLLRIFKEQRTLWVRRLFLKVGGQTSSFLVGGVFAFAWVACFSPILGSILVLASFQQTLSQGVVFLGLYSLGLAVPFSLTAFFIGFFVERVQFFARVGKVINLFSGAVLVVLGLLLLTDNFYKVVAWIGEVYR